MIQEFFEQVKKNISEIFGAGFSMYLTIQTELSSYIGGSVFLTLQNDLIHESIKSVFVVVNAVLAAIVVHLVKKWLDKTKK